MPDTQRPPTYLADYVQFSTPNDPALITVHERLAGYFDEAGNLPASIGIVDSLVEKSAQTLGQQDPFTRGACNHKARFLGLTGQPRDAALAVFAVLLTEEDIALLGGDHPIRERFRPGLAMLMSGDANPDRGTAAQCIEYVDALLPDCERALRPQHPAIRTARESMAILKIGMRSPAKPSLALQAPLADCLRVLGPEHPVLLTLRRHMIHHVGAAAGAAACAAAFQALLADCLRVLGSDHAVTQDVNRALNFWLNRVRSP